MISFVVAAALGGWHLLDGSSPDYAVTPRGTGAVIRRVSATTTYVGPYGDMGHLQAVADATPYHGKRIVVKLWVGKSNGTGNAYAYADVWGREGLLARDESYSHHVQFGPEATPCTFVLEIPPHAIALDVSILLTGNGEAFVQDAEIAIADAATPATAATLSRAIDDETRARVAAALRRAATPFDGNNETALTAVAHAVHGARIVGLAETSHGSGAEDARAADVFRYLAVHDDVRTLAVEAMFGTVRHLDAYVGGASEDVDLRLQQTNFHAFQTVEFRRLLDWMRAENGRRPPDRRLHVVGIDIAYSGPQSALVLQRLTEFDRVAAERAKRAYACVREADRSGAPQCLVAVRGVTDLLRRMAGSRDVSDELHAARSVEQYVEQYTGTTRDAAIAENIVWATEKRFPRARVAVWAHFLHLAGACCTGHTTTGLELEKRYHTAYYALGLIFGGGTSRAIPAGETMPREVPMPPAPPNTLEAVFDDVGADYFIDGHALAPVTQTWFSQLHRLRRIDLWTDARRPETTWTDERFGDALDGFIYLRTTDAAPLIERAKSLAAPLH